MPENETVERKFLPFHAVNEFMRDDFRLKVIYEVISTLATYPQEQRLKINKMVTRGVKLQGFRNASLAPVGIKVRGCVSLFEKSPEFVSSILEFWSRLHPDLKKGMYQVLVSKGWDLLPCENDRSELQGFQLEWPRKDSFEELVRSARDLNSGISESDDEISLMAVWLGNRLPYDLYDQEGKS